MTNIEWYGSNLIRRHQHRFRPFFLRKTACQKYFSNPFPKKRSDCESQKSGFGFYPKNPPWVWILWIHDPFLDMPKNTQNPFLDSEIRIWIFPKKRTLTSMSVLMGSVRKVIADCVEYLRAWRQNQHWYLGNRSREPVTSTFLPIRRPYWINSI